jgi:error-prone DNA polymerase
VKDAQRHGLKVLPIDVMKSDWNCTIEPSAVSASAPSPVIPSETFSLRSKGEDESRDLLLICPEKSNPVASSQLSVLSPALRLGLRYTRGLREEAAQALVRQRNLSPFTSIRDLVHRVPELRKDELNTLAEIGALNSIKTSHGSTRIHTDQSNTQTSVPQCLRGGLHRRDALWQVERAVRRSGPLLDNLSEPDSASPLRPMNAEERLVADFRCTGMTVGPHPMAYHRGHMDAIGVRKASDLRRIPDGQRLRVAGCVIARQRPGTAKGFVFLSLEDETGVANAIIHPDLFQKNRLLVSSEQFLLIEGILQNQDHVISVKAERVLPLDITHAKTASHDFY